MSFLIDVTPITDGESFGQGLGKVKLGGPRDSSDVEATPKYETNDHPKYSFELKSFNKLFNVFEFS